MFANIEDQLLTFTVESSSAMEGDCACLLYCTSADIEQRIGEAQDSGMNISAVYVVHNNKKLSVDSTDSHNDKSSLPRGARQNSTFHLIIKMESSYVHRSLNNL